ncbi:hypothetical protein [Actinoplanes solisilvae]|uniref:hypothetical protein n=1 Tax=Actinoplanes solisilvae TaxID=2486853 RepID=UPI000FD70433|nr:hypothetical protein [Actinoplanes solisilvae]
MSNRLGPALCRSFAGMRAVVIPRHIVIEGWLSAAEFRALLKRVDEVGGQIVHVDCTTGSDPGKEPPERPSPGGDRRP